MDWIEIKAEIKIQAEEMLATVEHKGMTKAQMIGQVKACAEYLVEQLTLVEGDFDETDI